ncbi:DUF6192 family protein [Streptomyces macrosporus]|uniref:DUF6192 family protein n=1 Tax=Streptomyces macrosporus TaxID=44032 RepID=UPI003CD0988B
MESPQTPQEKVESIHDLPVNDHVAAQVATDVLRRPHVAFHVAGDQDRPASVRHSPVGPAAAGRGGRTEQPDHPPARSPLPAGQARRPGAGARLPPGGESRLPVEH